MTGWKCLWPNITAPSMISSESSFASDSTISTASVRAGDHEVEGRASISATGGFSLYPPLT